MRLRIVAGLLLTISLLSVFGCPVESWGQERPQRVGILTFFPFADDSTQPVWFEPFRRKLASEGWIEGKSISLEYRDAGNDPSKFASAAAALAELKVDVIFAVSAPAVRAAHAATRSIPIVTQDFTNDPVAQGYIESYARPGGNVTGVFLDAPEFAGKWFEILRTIIPALSRVSVIWDSSPGPTHLNAVKNVARSLGIKVQVLEVRKPNDIGAAFSALRGRPQALIILPSPMLYVQSARLAKLARDHGLPATSMSRTFADAGGLIAYGPDMISASERCASFVAKILRGAKPADLPVERPTKFGLVINVKAANALGLSVPDSLLLRADEVIQ